MTDNEIKNALECCSKRSIWEDCPIDCPMYQFDGDCFDLIQKDILGLINRQQAEIDMLKVQNEHLLKLWRETQKDCDNLVKEMVGEC